jgi:heme a synthase
VILFLLVAAMVTVGGLTRLTGSGLSIPTWRPVTGAIPPTSRAAWEAELERYRQVPQYRLVNRGMSLAEFKRIYWWEWGHRQLGRVIGLVWVVGLVAFAATRRLPRGSARPVLVLGALGGLQGAIGWWMVASGLEGEVTRVAAARLATHLGLAFLILGVITWHVLALRAGPAGRPRDARAAAGAPAAVSAALLVVTFAQVLLGALVAGTDGGRGFFDWPLMNGEVFPSGALTLAPAWRNLLENPALAQFNHRTVGYVLALLAIVAWARSRRHPSRSVRRAFVAVLVATGAQFGLGIATVVTGAPWWLAIIHQLGALVLFTLVVRARFLAVSAGGLAVATPAGQATPGELPGRRARVDRRVTGGGGAPAAAPTPER